MGECDERVSVWWLLRVVSLRERTFVVCQYLRCKTGKSGRIDR